MFATERHAWQDPRIVALLVLIFLSGAIAGALAMQVWHHSIHSGGELSFEQLKTNLNLNPRQAEQVKTILDDFVRYNQDLQVQIEDVRATGKNRIRSILDDDQKKQFDRICSKLQDR